MAHTSTITGFETAPTSSGWMLYTTARLSCGHTASPKTDPGPCWHSRDQKPNYDRKVGDSVPCETCEYHAMSIERLKALETPIFRARFDPRFGGQYHLYRREENSPTGVMLELSVPAIPAIDEVLRAKRISPLSPTEERVY